MLGVTRFLLFTLYAPLASWGEIAVGESRGSWDRPSRSAVLGLLAAGLGITRDEQERHDALDAGYGVAVRLDAPGAALVDYHTAQTVAASAVKKHRPATRRALLAAGAPETILSRRAYRQDAVATVAVWTRRPEPGRPAPRWTLDALAESLRRPAFTLYAGRKANAFGLPLGPRTHDAATLADALAWYAGSRGMADDAPVPARAAVGGVTSRLRPRAGWGRDVAFDDPREDVVPGFPTDRRDVRRDAAAQRARWQFAERVVHSGTLPAAALATAPAGTGGAGGAGGPA